MSVIVKGMDMPTKCLDCPFMIGRDDDDCILQSDEANAGFESWDDMKANCPLIPLPSEHGELIDRDALYFAIVDAGQANKGKRYRVGDFWELNGAEIREVINSMPTIVDAERSGE